MKKTIVLLVIIIFTITSFGQNTKKDNSTLRPENDTCYYKISIETRWHVAVSKEKRTLTTKYLPIKCNYAPNSRRNIFFYLQPLVREEMKIQFFEHLLNNYVDELSFFRHSSLGVIARLSKESNPKSTSRTSSKTPKELFNRKVIEINDFKYKKGKYLVNKGKRPNTPNLGFNAIGRKLHLQMQEYLRKPKKN